MAALAGMTAIVTGGTRSIGRAISEALLAAGARVVALFAENVEAAERMRQEMAVAGDRLAVERLDVADYEAVEYFFRKFAERYGALHILVNNAGIRRDAVLAMMKREDWQRVIDVNLGGVYNMCKFGVHAMMAERYGRIINITSPCSHFGFEGQANYAAAKAGMIGLTRSLAREVARRGITANCISPGFIATDLLADLPSDLAARYREMVPLRRFGRPEEVAPAVLFFASREASYITGAVLEVAGGL